jgi:hypothetical protein
MRRRSNTALETAIKEHNANAQVDMLAAYEVGQEQAKVRTVTRTIREQVDKVVEKPVYRDCRLEPAALSLWNAANRGAFETPPTGKPDSAPSGATPAHRPVDGGDGAKPRRDFRLIP